MKILSKADILSILETIDIQELLKNQEHGFIAYSEKKAVIPPVGHLEFAQPPGDVHIKYGYIDDVDTYVIKIASGFYENPQLNLSTSNGMMIACKKTTGEIESILLDEGHLTDVRTGLAGAVVAKALTPKTVDRIGVIGTGIQARMQVQYALEYVPCKKILVYGRNTDKAQTYARDIENMGCTVNIANSPQEVAQNSQYIITTTPAKEPLLFWDDIQPGTHITAMGSDSPGKQELDSAILEQADLVVCDSITQCSTQGELQHLKRKDVHEIGDVLQNRYTRKEKDITVADLTGVAVQDIMIVHSVLQKKT